MFGVYAPAFPLKTENESVEEEFIKEIPAEVVENGPLGERNVVLANAFKCMQEEVEKVVVHFRVLEVFESGHLYIFIGHGRVF